MIVGSNPTNEAERRRLEQLRQKQLAASENNFTSERLFGRRFSGAACGVAEWRDDLKEAMRPESTEEENDEETTSESSVESLKSERSKDVRFDPTTNSPTSNEVIPAEGGGEQERKVAVGDETEEKKRSEEKSSEGGEVGPANEGEGEKTAVNEEENEGGDPMEE